MKLLVKEYEIKKDDEKLKALAVKKVAEFRNTKYWE